ncbi:hypothetical protein FJT64_013316 [Amphibalanus amphitrite]|uniref:Uncharacterized protein n=1 Tax=Amphibalanus amphitrite TaxID=1232801 RepID=A0A6A4UX61_AMPAM|nr:hypothetical protein FJT64_013316 [Amphibalanus amphitrite]
MVHVLVDWQVLVRRAAGDRPAEQCSHGAQRTRWSVDHLTCHDQFYDVSAQKYFYWTSSRTRQIQRRRRAAASSDDDRLAAFARDLSDSWYSDLPPKLDAGGVSTSNANKKSTFIRLFSHRVKRTTPRGRPANSNERSEGHTPIDFYCFVAYVPLPPLSQHNGVPVLRCRIEKRLVQRTDGCGPRDEPPPHTELRRADVKVELAAACSVPSTASTGSPAICGQKRRRFWDQGVRARRCP